MKTDLQFPVLGLDISTKLTGFALARVNPIAGASVQTSGCIRLVGNTGQRKPGKRGKDSRALTWEDIHPVKRIMHMRDKVADICDKRNPGLVVIEGYAYASPKRTYLPFVAECTGLIKAYLLESGIPYIIVTPSQLKKFATGKGNSKKTVVIDFAELITGSEFIDDNEADAVILAAFGCCLAGSAWHGATGKKKKWTDYNTECVGGFRFDNSGGTAQSMDEVCAYVGSASH